MARVNFLTTEDVAKRFQVSKATVIKWTKLEKNPLRYSRPSKRIYRFEESDLEAFMKSPRNLI